MIVPILDEDTIQFIYEEMLEKPFIDPYFALQVSELAKEDYQMFKMMNQWILFDNDTNGQMEVEETMRHYLNGKNSKE